MRCLSPRTVGFLADGKTLCWSQKHYSKEFATFPFPCGKCVECRAEQGSTKAIRCVHEASLHLDNCFITLTYDDRFCPVRLDKAHVQGFVKRLRSRYGEGIRVVWTGEYGDLKKRPHWHLLVFGWSPKEPEFLYTTDRGDKVYWSRFLGPRDVSHVDSICSGDTVFSKKMLWKFGKAEFGSLSIHSASYVCRYALKKLVHGYDQDHDFHPIHNFRNKIGIGKLWIEKYWRDVFNSGFCLTPDGDKVSIPRYYVDWLMKNQPEAWIRYVTKVKADRISALSDRFVKEELCANSVNDFRISSGKLTFQTSKLEVMNVLSKNKFARLQARLKGDL